MRNQVHYEWDVETVDLSADPADPDIIEHDHSESFPGFPAEPDKRLVLVRNEGNDADGLVDRQWAYVEGRALPERFSDGVQEAGVLVPQRFHRQIARAARNA